MLGTLDTSTLATGAYKVTLDIFINGQRVPNATVTRDFTIN